ASSRRPCTPHRAPTATLPAWQRHSPSRSDRSPRRATGRRSPPRWTSSPTSTAESASPSSSRRSPDSTVGCGRRRTAASSSRSTPTVSGGRRGRSAPPEVGDADADLTEQRAQERQADADDPVVVALDPADERAAETVHGEGARDDERLTGGDVGVDLGVAEVGEVHGGRGDGAGLGPVAGAAVDEPVP